jgi:hypothetical protein
MLWVISMVNDSIGICDRFQQEMKYHCNRMAGRVLTGIPETRNAGSIRNFSLRNLNKYSG